MERRQRENPGLSGIPVLLGSELSRHAHVLRGAVLRGHLLFIHRRRAGPQLCGTQELYQRLEQRRVSDRRQKYGGFFGAFRSAGGGAGAGAGIDA